MTTAPAFTGFQGGLDELGRLWRAYLGETEGWKKVRAVATLAGPVARDFVYAWTDPKSWEGSPVKPRALMPGQKAWAGGDIDIRDVPRAATWFFGRFKEILRDDPGKLREAEARKTPLIRLGVTLWTDPYMYLPYGKIMKGAGALVKYGIERPIVGRVAATVGRAVEKVAPTLGARLERFFLTPVARITRWKDPVALYLYYRLKEIGEAGVAREMAPATEKAYREAELQALAKMRGPVTGETTKARQAAEAKEALLEPLIRRQKVKWLGRQRKPGVPLSAEEAKIFKERTAESLELTSKGAKTAAEAVKRVFHGFTDREAMNAMKIAEKHEDLAAYGKALKAGEVPKPYSKRELELALGPKSIRMLTKTVFKTMPGARTAMPGVETAAALKRIEAAGGMEKAAQIRLKPGEYRIGSEELGKAVSPRGVEHWVDRATGEVTIARRKGYFPPRTRPLLERPMPQMPRKIPGPGVPIGRTGAQVREDLVRMMEDPALVKEDRALAGELLRRAGQIETAAAVEAGERVVWPRAVRKEAAAIAGKTAAGKVLVQQEAALETLRILTREYGPKHPIVKVLEGIWFLPKMVYTTFNFAFHVKNYIDTVVGKPLLAGVPLGKLHRYATTVPENIYGKAVDWAGGGGFGKELFGTAWMPEQLKWLNGISETIGRRAGGNHAYWGEIERLGGAEALRRLGPEAVAKADRSAYLAAKKFTAKIFFDYGDRSKLDEYARLAYPFWMYQRNQPRWLAQDIVRAPRLWYGAYHAFISPGLPVKVGNRLEIEPLQLTSPFRLMQTLSGGSILREWEKKSGRRPGNLEFVLRNVEAFAVYPHPALERALSALFSKQGYMDDRNWKSIAPLLDAVAKATGRRSTWEGIWSDRDQERRILQRVAFSELEGKPQTAMQAAREVKREMLVDGLFSSIGLFPRVREPAYDKMQGLLKRWRATEGWDERERLLNENPGVRTYMLSWRVK